MKLEDLMTEREEPKNPITPDAYVFRFGVHKGADYNDVASTHKGREYILWADSKVDRFNLDNEEYDRILKQVQEVNGVKRKKREQTQEYFRRVGQKRW